MNDQERVKAVELLLRDLLGYLPRPRQPSDLVSSQSGLAPGRSVPCPACGARGRVLKPGKVCLACPPRLGPKAPPPAFDTNHRCKPCLNCKGTGWKRKSVPKGQPGTDWDEYSGTRHSDRSLARDTKPWEREQHTARQLRHSERLLALWEAPETTDEVWVERKAAQWNSGSYDELVRLLRYLEQTWPARYSLVWRFHVLEEPLVLSAAIQERLDETLAWIAKLMPGEIRVPAHIARELDPEQKNTDRKTSLERGRAPAHARERKERDDEIRRLRYDEEWKIARLSRQFKLSERMIKTITAVPTASGVAA